MEPIEKLVESYDRIMLTREDWEMIFHGRKVPINTTKKYGDPSFIWIQERVIALAKIQNGYVSTKKLLAKNLLMD